ncbi:hypothetical protein ABH944_000008 [Caballeronia udeis]|jgi:hypothetical protein|uniref:Uncharacterized protein n=1 Tax=Caballeronia udeis TaxID=1232866 RepID=A0ABW8M8L8_9BURK
MSGLARNRKHAADGSSEDADPAPENLTWQTLL